MPPRMPTSITVMSDSDGSPQRNDRHHRRYRSRSPVSPGYAAAGGGHGARRATGGAAPANPEPPAQEPAPAEEAAPAAQAANPAAPPPEGAPGTQGAETAAPASRATAQTDHATAPGTPLAQGAGRERALGASPRAAAAAVGGRDGAKYRANTNPSHTHTSSPEPYPPKAAFPEWRPQPVRPRAPTRTPPGVTLPQLRRQQDPRRVDREGGDGAQAGQGTGHGSAE